MRNHKKLKKVINEMVALARKVYPHVEYVAYTGGYSGVDATIEFFTPTKYEDRLDKVLRDRGHKALTKENLFIAPVTRSIKHKAKPVPQNAR